MALKQNKRALEDAKSCQPVKYHKQSEYSIDQAVGIEEIVSSKIYGKMHPLECAQLERFCGDKSLISSREINSSNDISFNVGTYFLEKDVIHEKPVEVVKTDDDGSVMTELVHSQNSVCGHKQEHSVGSSVSMPTEEVVDEAITDGTFGNSNLCDNFRTAQERVCSQEEAKDIETYISVSSVGNSRRSRVSEDFDFDLVSASSLSSKNVLCDSDTMARECKGSEKIDHSLPPPFVSDSGDFCSRTCAESDCNEEYFSHCESATGFGGYYRKKVPIGAEFQVEIPVCRPQVCISSSDSPDLMLPQACFICKDDDDDTHSHRMLGNCVWPLAGTNDGLQDYCVGQGRSTYCGCPDSNSIRCVKEHIEVEREKLKLKLGKAFSLWGFDDMGESVSQKWTRQEEETFSDIVSMNPMSSNKNFWNYLSVAFPSRRKEDLVSYYFNVFVLRRRALQNRIDPDNIDSDDDEEDWHESEIGVCDGHIMIEEDDDSDADSDGSDGDDEVSESDEEMPGATEEEDEVAVNFMSEGHMTSRTNHKISYPDPENHLMDSQDEDMDDLIGEFAFPLQHRLVESNHREFIEGQDLQNDSCMPYEWNHGSKSSSLMCIRSAGVHSVQEEKFKEAISCEDSCKEERLADLHYGNEVLCGGGKPYGNLSRKEFIIDAHSSFLEPYDSKLWDIALVTSLKTDADRLVSTCSLIKELFGDDTRENDRKRS